MATYLLNTECKLNILKIFANPGLFFAYFRPFTSQFSYKLKKNIDGVIGIQTRGRRMVGADETTELYGGRQR